MVQAVLHVGVGVLPQPLRQPARDWGAGEGVVELLLCCSLIADSAIFLFFSG